MTFLIKKNVKMINNKKYIIIQKFTTIKSKIFPDLSLYSIPFKSKNTYTARNSNIKPKTT